MLRQDPELDRPPGRLAPGAAAAAPSAAVGAGGSVWAATTASRASHLGGTLHFASPPFDYCNCIDPAGYDGRNWPVLSLAYDGLVAYRRIPGAGGSRLVADLASGVPQATDGGRTYAFQLRKGCGSPTGAGRPEDFRASIERTVGLSGELLYAGIDGANACRPRRCDLSKGIETDAAASTITIHLRRPDAEFAHKLALPLAYVLPARAPAKPCTRPPAGTAPYVISAFTRNAASGSCATRALSRGRPRRVPTGSRTQSTSCSPPTAPRRWLRYGTDERTPSSSPGRSARNCRLNRPARWPSPTPATSTRRRRPARSFSFSTCAKGRSATRASVEPSATRSTAGGWSISWAAEASPPCPVK